MNKKILKLDQKSPRNYKKQWHWTHVLIATHNIAGTKSPLVKWEMNRIDLGTAFIAAIIILYRLGCLFNRILPCCDMVLNKWILANHKHIYYVNSPDPYLSLNWAACGYYKIKLAIEFFACRAWIIVKVILVLQPPNQWLI